MAVTATAADPVVAIGYDTDETNIAFIYDTIVTSLANEAESIRQTALKAFNDAMTGTPNLADIVAAAAKLQMDLAAGTASDEAVKKFVEAVSRAVGDALR